MQVINHNSLKIHDKIKIESGMERVISSEIAMMPDFVE